jgi:NADPH:quinone reductase-like Zn-dependent oxidoreductase
VSPPLHQNWCGVIASADSSTHTAARHDRLCEPHRPRRLAHRRAGEGPGRTLVMAAPTPENLERLARLLGDGTLRVHIQDTYEIARAPAALTALATTHTQGKLAIRVA